MKKVLFPALAGMLLATGACRRAPSYDATGFFEATAVTVSAETGGKLLDFGLSEGDTVAPGQQVALVDTTLLALQYRQLASQQAAAEKSAPDIAAQAAALRTQIDHQRHECARQEQLLADGAATHKQHDDAQARLRLLEGQLEGLLSTLDKSRGTTAENALALQYQREQVGQQIARCRVTAPTGGTVLAKYAEPGEFVTPGRPLFKVADLGRIYLRCYFTASQLARLRLGQKVTVIADFGGDERHEYPGTVSWIAAESEFTPKSVQTADSRASLVYAVKVAVRGDGRLKLGQYGEVRL